MYKWIFCILDWTFDNSDKHILSNNKEKIPFLSANNIQVHSQQLSPNDSIKYLGVVSQPIVTKKQLQSTYEKKQIYSAEPYF